MVLKIGYLVANHQWGMKSPPLMKDSLYPVLINSNVNKAFSFMKFMIRFKNEKVKLHSWMYDPNGMFEVLINE